MYITASNAPTHFACSTAISSLRCTKLVQKQKRPLGVVAVLPNDCGAGKGVEPPRGKLTGTPCVAISCAARVWPMTSSPFNKKMLAIRMRAMIMTCRCINFDSPYVELSSPESKSKYLRSARRQKADDTVCVKPSPTHCIRVVAGNRGAALIAKQLCVIGKADRMSHHRSAPFREDLLDAAIQDSRHIS
jgi:hypothetical protein